MWSWPQPANRTETERMDSPPLVPDADEAREIAEDELARAIYDDSPTLWDRIGEWFSDLFNELTLGPPSAQNFILIALLVALVIAAVALLFMLRPARGSIVNANPSMVFDADDRRSAREIRHAAAEAASREQWNIAVVEQFRALVRSIEENGWLTRSEGSTSREVMAAVSRLLGPRAVEFTDPLLAAATDFDAAYYGHANSTGEQLEALRQLDQKVETWLATHGPAGGHDVSTGSPAGDLTTLERVSRR